jgi:hypothetical protein
MFLSASSGNVVPMKQEIVHIPNKTFHSLIVSLSLQRQFSALSQASRTAQNKTAVVK